MTHDHLLKAIEFTKSNTYSSYVGSHFQTLRTWAAKVSWQSCQLAWSTLMAPSLIEPDHCILHHVHEIRRMDRLKDNSVAKALFLMYRSNFSGWSVLTSHSWLYILDCALRLFLCSYSPIHIAAMYRYIHYIPPLDIRIYVASYIYE